MDDSRKRLGSQRCRRNFDQCNECLVDEMIISRLRFAIFWASLHLLISLVVAGFSASLVFILWYPEPWWSMLRVIEIFGILLIVDLVCGPLLTMVLASPAKSLRERRMDIGMVAAIQLMALAYGLWTVFIARPIAVVFEEDRFVLVTANEVMTEQLSLAPQELQSLPWTDIRALAVRQAHSSEEHLQSLELSLQGISPAMRPGWWIRFRDARDEIDRMAQPLQKLIKNRPDDLQKIMEAVKRTGISVEELRFLPLTASKDRGWVMLINGEGSPVGHARVDGFLE